MDSYNQRRPVDLDKGESKGRSEKVQPLDMDVIKREAEEYRKRRHERSQDRGEDHGEGFDL